jgi:SH3-like domain-containing protein
VVADTACRRNPCFFLPDGPDKTKLPDHAGRLRIGGQHRGIAAPPCPVGGEVATGSVSGLPIPRFVSLKSDRVNVRSGPNKDQEVRWVYTHAGMPVEITAEFENCGASAIGKAPKAGSIIHCLSGKRTAMVLPKAKDELVPLFESADIESAVAARLQSGVLGALKSCNGSWCQFGGRALKVISGKNACGAPIRTRKWTNFAHGSYYNEKAGTGPAIQTKSTIS